MDCGVSTCSKSGSHTLIVIPVPPGGGGGGTSVPPSSRPFSTSGTPPPMTGLILSPVQYIFWIESTAIHITPQHSD